MKFSLLRQIVFQAAENKRLDAEYMDAKNDGGAESLRRRFQDFKHELVVKYDLRPSEFGKLEDINVGEPEEFHQEIDEYKMMLARSINL